MHRLRDGLIVEADYYLDRSEALEAVGLSEQLEKSAFRLRGSETISATGTSIAEGEAMDEGKTRQYVQEHADAVARGDLEAAVADFSEELRPQAPQTA
jgi:hypothetical protein